MQDFVFAPFNLFSAVALLLLAVWGGWIERRSAILFAAVLVLTPLIDSYSIGGFRWAVAFSSLSLFIILVVMALKSDRWWLVLAAGCQLMALSTHLVALLRIDSLQWTMVSIRWCSWLFMMGVAVFGAWEGRALTLIARGRDAPA